METAEKLAFSYNWNNKLDCKAFTTVRIDNSKYQVGGYVEVSLNGKHHSDCKIIDKKTVLFTQFNEFMAHIDTGYSLDEFKGILKKMYKEAEKQTYCILLLKKLT